MKRGRNEELNLTEEQGEIAAALKRAISGKKLVERGWDGMERGREMELKSYYARNLSLRTRINSFF